MSISTKSMRKNLRISRESQYISEWQKAEITIQLSIETALEVGRWVNLMVIVLSLRALSF